MARCNHIDHAKHNEKVCNYVSKKEEFCDWIITTAFYSAVHYVRHYMLPIKHTNGVTYDCFEKYFSSSKYADEGRHGFQNRFVTHNIPEIAAEYKQLHDWCTNARYFEYNQPRNLSNYAKDNLKQIKKHILELKP